MSSKEIAKSFLKSVSPDVSGLSWALAGVQAIGFQELDDKWAIAVSCDKQVGACPHCGKKHVVNFGRVPQVLKDTPMAGKPVTIYFDTRRFRCQSCGKTFMERPSSFHPTRNMTKRLETFILRKSAEMEYVAVAAMVDVVEGTVRSLLREKAEQAAA